LEKWFVAVYQADGTLQRNRTIGPYFVSYILRKIDGRWLIEKSNTGRVIRPTPRLDAIEPTSDLKAGHEFHVKITGQDFEAEMVLIEVVGPGCPESMPCRISNKILLENAKITTATLDRVPLTLASGEFTITARNSDSQPSNPVYLKVP
jgi:hypothetical protein